MDYAVPRMLGPSSVYTSAEARDLHRTYQVRLAALVCSGVSVVSLIIVFYWFCRMEKLFRHRLILLLLWGDLTSCTFYFVFAVYSLARGTVSTQSKFCQASGFFTQYGAETTDYAVLAIAVHSALQVFRPATRGTSDGLYKYRYYLYFGGLAIPSLMASLAFINPGPAYLSLGAFCMLPIRPFWYRLALSWIPRYLIAGIIISLAIAIYAYVGCEFRAYASASQNFTTPTSTTTTTTTRGGSCIERDAEIAFNPSEAVEKATENAQRGFPISYDVVASQHKGSPIAFATEKHTIDRTSANPSRRTQSESGNSIQFSLQRNLSSQPPLLAIPAGYTVTLEPEPSPTSLHGGPLTPIICHNDDPLSNVPTQATSTKDASSFRDTSPTSPTSNHRRHQRNRMNRQLRLMFIYPLMYTLMWLIPFIYHCMMYSDYFANQPLWFFRIGATICFTSMGFVDCLIFSLREKPWRSIQTSDGTIWDSLAVWRSPRLSNAGLVSVSRDGKIRGVGPVGEAGQTRMERIRSSVRSSASDDYSRIAAEQANVRLDMEKVERLARFKVREAEKRKMSEGRGSEKSQCPESKYGRGGEEVEAKGKQEKVVANMVHRIDWAKERK